jgi:hypothetical protein
MSSLRDVEAGFRALIMGTDDGAVSGAAAGGVFAGVPAERQRVYRTLVRNSLRGSIRRSCPHAIRLAGDEAFDAVVDAFLAGCPIQTRLTRDIPGEFTAWLMARASSSPSSSAMASTSITSSVAFAELCHFEALEIDVTMSETAPHMPGALQADARVEMDPSARLAIYRHPVQTVTSRSTSLPVAGAQPTVLLCFQRAEAFEVEVISPALGKVLLGSAEGPVAEAIAAVVAEGRAAGVVIDAGRLRSELVGLHRRGAIAGFPMTAASSS